MRTLLIMFSAILVLSCNTDKSMERRITALERRVAALEEQNSLALSGNRVSPESLNVQKANVSSDSLSKKPKFFFEQADFDFGTINEGEVVQHMYKFKNTGNAPLVISKATASCGCTVPSPPKEAILPGQSSQIQVRFDSRNKPNQQVKTITVEANTDPAITKLQLHGFVVPKKKSN
jgi:hypothetical protein